MTFSLSLIPRPCVPGIQTSIAFDVDRMSHSRALANLCYHECIFYLLLTPENIRSLFMQGSRAILSRSLLVDRTLVLLG